MRSWRARRLSLAPAVAGAVALAVFVAYVAFSAPFDSDLRGQDIDAYWSAAERIRAGGELYVETWLPYTYAPWFAYVWVPVTVLDRQLVEVVWLTILVGAVIWLALPLVRSYAGTVLALLVVPQILEYAWIGNVDPLMLAGLAFLHARSGPVVVGVAASLKITPIAFALVYVARREWTRAAVSVGIAIGLWLHALAFDLSGFGSAGYDATTPYSLLAYGPVAWSVGAGLCAAVLIFVAVRGDPRHTLLVAAVAAMIGNPRMNLYNVGYLILPARFAMRRTAASDVPARSRAGP